MPSTAVAAGDRARHRLHAAVFGRRESASFYLGNPFFWAKMSAFGVIGLLSIAGTIRYQRWASAAGDQRRLDRATR